MLRTHEYVAREVAATETELHSFVSTVILTDPKVKQHVSARKVEIMEKPTFDQTEHELDEWIHRQFDWWLKQRLKTLRRRAKAKIQTPSHTVTPSGNYDSKTLTIPTPVRTTTPPPQPQPENSESGIAISIPATPASFAGVKVKRKSEVDPDLRPSKKSCTIGQSLLLHLEHCLKDGLIGSNAVYELLRKYEEERAPTTPQSAAVSTPKPSDPPTVTQPSLQESTVFEWMNQTNTETVWLHCIFY